MKKKFLVICLLSSYFSFSQQYSLTDKLVSAYLPVTDNRTVKEITMKTEVDKDDFYEVTLDLEGAKESFKLKPLTFPNFKAKFKQTIGDVIKTKGLIANNPSNDVVDNEIALLFSQIVTYHNSEEERPEVATIYLKENIPVYFYKRGDTIDKTIKAKLSNAKVEISFYGGFIEKMQVNGKIGDVPVTFNNKYSIGISSTKNIQQLNDYRLFTNQSFTGSDFKGKMIPKSEEKDSEKRISIANDDLLKSFNDFTSIEEKCKNKKLEIKNLETSKAKTDISLKEYKEIEEKIGKANEDLEIIEGTKRKALEELEIKGLALVSSKNKTEIASDKKDSKKDNEDENSLVLFVSDVIRYVKKVDVNANDISPVPQLVILDDNQKETKLYREESSKLFEAVVYTDFFGIFDEENPNGIIQTEVNKQFNISSRRFDVLPAFIEGCGFFNYFNAMFQFSKIEKTNKFLLPTVDGGISYYTLLSLYQYRNFSIGGNLNLLFLENQNAKINTTLDAGFLFGRSGIKETENQIEGQFLSNLEIPIELKFHILPEKRFSFVLSDRLSWFEVFDSNVNLKSVEDGELVSKNRFLNTFNVGMNLDISSSGKLFLRYKLVHELDNINNNFSQLQFGYSFYLLQKNGVRKNK